MRSDWRRAVEPFTGPDARRASFQLVTTLGALAVVMWANHVHHVAPRIPNYRLQSCHDASALFHRSPVVTFRSRMAALRLALWDESRGGMVGFRDVTDNAVARRGA